MEEKKERIPNVHVLLQAIQAFLDVVPDDEKWIEQKMIAQRSAEYLSSMFRPGEVEIHCPADHPRFTVLACSAGHPRIHPAVDLIGCSAGHPRIPSIQE